MKFKLIIIIMSIILLVSGAILTGTGNRPELLFPLYNARVTEILDISETTHPMGDIYITNTNITFSAEVATGSERGRILIATQNLTDFTRTPDREVRVGDRVIIEYIDFIYRGQLIEYVRIHYIIVSALVLLVFIMIFGRSKGFGGVVALGLTILAIFTVYVPAVLAGFNIFVATVLVCLYSLLTTVFIVVGATKKAVSAVLGSVGGLALTAFILIITDLPLGLTGAVDTETIRLLYLDNPVSLRALIFSGIVVGALGAILDVAMSISSSLWEVEKAARGSFQELFSAGLNIGRDILGTMLNTLILAYIGSSFSIILLLSAYTASFTALFNMEMIIVELLRAIAGSFGIFLTIPLTSFVCAWMYSHE